MKIKIGDLKLEDGVTIREIYDTCESHLGCEECPYDVGGDHCANVITDTEIEIPQTVKRGRWEYEEHAVDFNIGGWCCSECGTHNNNLPTSEAINPYQFSGSKYCPQCGAKMDETEEV